MTATGRYRASTDHLVPRSRGGANLNGEYRLICCQDCNSDKGDKSLHEWLERLQRGRDLRARFVAEFMRMNAELVLSAHNRIVAWDIAQKDAAGGL